MSLKPWTIPLGIYIHIPWCIKKCPYCDFNSHENSNPPFESYADHLISDFETDLSLINNRLVSSIFIGGGTPSLMPPKILERVLQRIRANCKISNNLEITLEMNPGTLEQNYISGFKDIGINRLSLGIQSFDDYCLTKLGRIHNSKIALEVLNEALSLDFDSINVDLMHGIPGQTKNSAINDLNILINKGIKHISWYSLTIEPNTYFFSKTPNLPELSLCEEIDITGEMMLKNSGLTHYEISAFAEKNFHCRHNTNVWKFGDYLGLGAGAHGKVTGNDSIKRSIRTRHPSHYLSRKKTNAQWNILTSEEAGLECLMNGLRLAKGISYSLFENRTGAKVTSFIKKIENSSKGNLCKNRLQITRFGWRYLDNILCELV